MQTVRMRCKNVVHVSVVPICFDAIRDDVSRWHGNAMGTSTVLIKKTNRSLAARLSFTPATLLISGAITINAFPVDGIATMTMIAATTLTRSIVPLGTVPSLNSGKKILLKY